MYESAIYNNVNTCILWQLHCILYSCVTRQLMKSYTSNSKSNTLLSCNSANLLICMSYLFVILCVYVEICRLEQWSTSICFCVYVNFYVTSIMICQWLECTFSTLCDYDFTTCFWIAFEIHLIWFYDYTMISLKIIKDKTLYVHLMSF